MEEKKRLKTAAVKTPDELIEIAKESGMELDENEKKTLYRILNDEDKKENTNN